MHTKPQLSVRYRDPNLPNILIPNGLDINFLGENAQQQFNMGWCYQHGLWFGLNLAKAAQYYSVSAGQGHCEAQYQLGVCFAAGMGVKQDMRQAIFYYEQAAVQGHVQAHYVLSQCYESGLGINPDAKKASEHRKAAQKGHHPGLVALEKMLVQKKKKKN